MDKPALLYASPFPPQRSGIAIYSLWLVEALSGYFDITLYLDCDPSDPYLDKFPIIRRGRDDDRIETFDYRLYQIGNNPWYHGYIYEACLRHPGWVVLHEFALYFLVAGLYHDRCDFYQRIFRIGGASAIAALRTLARTGEDVLRFKHPERVPLNRELLASGNRIVVHSDYTRRLVEEVTPAALVHRTELVQGERPPTASLKREEFLARNKWPADAILIASFGFVAPTKLNHVVCAAINRIVQQRGGSVYYVMVGEGDYVQSYLNDRIRVTGFVSDDVFDEYLVHADLVLNLRFPVMGETSAALLRAFLYRKPCIVTDIGWFSELPNDVVLKLDVSEPDSIEQQIVEVIDIFLASPKAFHRMAERAACYVRERHSATVVAKQLFSLLTTNG